MVVVVVVVVAVVAAVAVAIVDDVVLRDGQGVFLLKMDEVTHPVSIDYNSVVMNLEDESESPLRPIELRHVVPRSNDDNNKKMKLIDHRHRLLGHDGHDFLHQILLSTDRHCDA